MKKIFTLILVLFIPLLLSAQKIYHRFSIGVGTGLATNYGDLRAKESKQVYIANLEYFFNPYLVGSGEVSVGNMAAEGLTSDRYFRSNFKAATGNVRLYTGKYIDKFRGPMYRVSKFSQALQGIYTSVGAGVIKSNQNDIYRKKDDSFYRGWNSDRDVIIPVGVGIDNSAFNSKIVTGIRYQYNFGLGDNIDGYAISGSGRDMFSTISLSVKYKFGPKNYY